MGARVRLYLAGWPVLLLVTGCHASERDQGVLRVGLADVRLQPGER